VRLRLAVSLAALCSLIAPVVQGDCKCRQSAKDDKTRPGGNEAVSQVPEEHFRELKGVVSVFGDQPAENALAEVFDKPEYLLGNEPWDQRPTQNRLRECVTSPDGKFCFKDLPSGTYELRISRDPGWDVTHVYVVVDRKAGARKPIQVEMHIGT
jgi:hypothetical protein